MEEEFNLNDLYKDLTLDTDPHKELRERILENHRQPISGFKGMDLSTTVLTKDKLEKVAEPRELTFEDDFEAIFNAGLQEDIKNKKRNIIGSASIGELQRYNDPNIKYNPNVDMEEVYAAAHPATLGRAVQKAYHTGKSTLFYGINNTIENIKRLGTDESLSLFGNEEAKGMADAFLKAEMDYPLYYSKNDSELKKLGLDVVAASGSMVSSIIDGLASSALVTLAGSVVGNPELGLVGLASKAKTAVGFLKATKGMNQAAKKLATARQLKGLSQLGRTALTTHLTVTGEAALQAELNKRDFIEKRITEYQALNGVQPSGKELEEINKVASTLESATYAQNFLLVGASTMIQLPALMRGKVTNSYNPNSLFKVVNGKTQAKSLKKLVGTEFLKDSLSEAGEEYFQSVIDSATQSYFKKKLDGKTRNYMEDFFKSTIKVADEGALREALIGGILGGGMSIVKNSVSAYKAKGQRDSAMDTFNEQTKTTAEFLRNDIFTNERMNEAEHPVELNNLMDEKIINIAKAAKKSGVDANRRDYLESLKSVPIEDFKQEMGMTEDIDEATRDSIIDNMLSTFDSTIQIMQDADLVFNVNPIVNDNWFVRAAKRLSNKTAGTKYDIANQLHNDLKEIYVDALTKNKSLGDRLNELSLEIELAKTVDGRDIAVVVPDLFTDILSDPTNLGKSLTAYVANLKELSKLPSDIISGQILFKDGDKKLLEKLENLEDTNIYTKLATILRHFSLSEDTAEKIRDYIRVYNSKKLFEDEIENLHNPSKQREKYKDIMQYYEYIYRDVEKKQEEIIKKKAEEVKKKEEVSEETTLKETKVEEKAKEIKVKKAEAKQNNKMAEKNKKDVSELKASEVSNAVENARGKSSISFLKNFQNKVKC